LADDVQWLYLACLNYFPNCHASHKSPEKISDFFAFRITVELGLAVVAGETVTLSFSGALAPGGSGNSFPHVDQVRFEVSILGDFNGDFKVDGFDFLAWQRGFGDTYDETDFADWEANYGTSPLPLSAATANVPKPTALLLGVMASLGALVVRLRKSE
jgi:hypothetical protein